MFRKSWLQVLALGICLASAALAGTFGKVVAIGGHASDIALDEARGVLYVANFTANRIEVMSLSNNTVRTSINVPSQPASLAISPDGHYLVIAHYGNLDPKVGASTNGLTVVDLNSGGRQFYSFGLTPLGVAFGIDNKALIATTQDWELFDPVNGTLQTIDTIAGVTAKQIPVATDNNPSQVVSASMATSGDGLTIWGMSDQVLFYYDVNTQTINGGLYTSSPLMTPRTISVPRDGSYAAMGWMIQDKRFQTRAQWPNPSGVTGIGSTAIDSARNIIYAQIPMLDPTAAATTTTTTTPPAGGSSGTTTPTTAATSQPPVLQIQDADNLTVRQRLHLPENLTGKSLLSSDGNVMYSVSDSGVLVMPVGNLNSVARIGASVRDLVFRGSGCGNTVVSQNILISDPGGNAVDFTLSASTPGVTFSPASGTTPRTVQVSVDPTAFQTAKGTTAVTVAITSQGAVNIPQSFRVLVNLHDPDQRGTTIDIPGTLVDMIADPTSDRLFVLRQDTSEVLVYDSNTFTQLASLRTGATPQSMTITFDKKWLLVANSNSGYISVFDMGTLQPSTPISLGYGPKGEWRTATSVASAGGAVLAAVHSAAAGAIQKIDMVSRIGIEPASLGIYKNSVPNDTVLIATPNGSSIMAASTDGSTLLYDSNSNTFTVSRKDFNALSGAYAASSYGQFLVGDTLLNGSLVPVGKLDTSSGTSSGFAFVDDYQLRLLYGKSAADPGNIQHLASGSAGVLTTRLIEAPLTGTITEAFTRTLAVTYSRNALAGLSVTGLTVLPWVYNTPIVPPSISSVVNAASGSQSVAPGSLVSIYGANLSPVSLTSSTIPLPTSLGDSCLTVNGIAVPVLFVSPSQINAQLPYETDGNVTLILKTPSGTSDNYNLTVSSGAPSVFSGSVGGQVGVPTIIRALNNEILTASNPAHRGETIVIYVAGLGKTVPAVPAGQPAPESPLASVVTPVRVDVGGYALSVAFAGLVPDQIGLYQINAVIPKNAPTGLNVPLTIAQGQNSTTVNIRVVE